MPNDYIIARRRIRLDGPHSDLAAMGLRSFGPFAAGYDPAAATAVTIETGVEIAPGALRHEELTRFDFDEGQAVCRFGRTADGAEYTFVIENEARGAMVFIYDRATDRVRCNIGTGGRPDPSFVRFGVWFMTNIAVAPLLASAVHSSTIVYGGEAVMFLGESGTGKSTHTRLWRENVEGAGLLNDDSPFVAVADGKAEAFGSPWSGKTPCYKNESYPLRAIVRLSQAPHNAIRRLRGAQAVGALLPSLPPAFAYDEQMEESMLATLSSVIAAVPVYHLECLPDKEAAQLARNTIFG